MTPAGNSHYPAYAEDAGISHAHGWSTGPTSTLTFYATGLKLVSAGGAEWRMELSLGGLENMVAGYVLTLGRFDAQWKSDKAGGITGSFTTLTNTNGTLILKRPTNNGTFILRY